MKKFGSYKTLKKHDNENTFEVELIEDIDISNILNISNISNTMIQMKRQVINMIILRRRQKRLKIFQTQELVRMPTKSLQRVLSLVENKPIQEKTWITWDKMDLYDTSQCIQASYCGHQFFCYHRFQMSRILGISKSCITKIFSFFFSIFLFDK